MNRSRKNRGNKERGVAMLVAILAMVLLAIIGLGFMYMADTENSANNNYKDSQRAYFASRAGLESVRNMLALGSPFAGVAAAMRMPATAVAANMVYVENSTGAAVDPTGGTTLDTELCKEQFPNLPLGPPSPQGAPCTVAAAFGDFTPMINPGAIPDANTEGAMLFPWVRVTNKQNYMGLLNQMVDGSNPATATATAMAQQVCWDGLTQYPIASEAGATCAGTPSPGTGGQMNPIWVLTSLALTPPVGQKPGSRRMTQMEVSIPPPLYVLPDGTVSAKAPLTIKGKLTVSGYDNCKCTATGSDLPGQTCDKTKWAIYSANQVTNQVPPDALTSGQDPPIYQNAPWPYKIPQLINALSAGAVPPSDMSCTGTADPFATPPKYENCGTLSGETWGGVANLSTNPVTFSPSGSGPVTTYIPGSVHLTGNTQGSGILIVDGDLDVNGGLFFYGLILVRGQINFTGGGSQPVNLYGAILAGQDVNAQDQTDGDSVGGSFNFHYDSCALKLPAKQIPGPPALLAEHEAMY